MGWRALLALSALPLLVFSLLCFWLPESARYHVALGERAAAMAILQRIADDNGRLMPQGTLVCAPPPATGDAPQRRVDLLDWRWRRTTLLLWWIWMANAFS